MRRCRRCWGCSPGEAAAEHERWCWRCWGCSAGEAAAEHELGRAGVGAGGVGGVRPVRLLQSIDYAALAPVLVAAVGVVAVLVADVALPIRRRPLLLWVGVVAAAGALAASLALAGRTRSTFCTPATTLPGGVQVGPTCSYVVDKFTVFLLVVISAAALVVLVASAAVVDDRRGGQPQPGQPQPGQSQPAGEYTLLVLA